MKSTQTDETDNERAVSPVIGVILMVAVTVILAAVIATFVMGISPGQEPVTGGVETSVNATETEATVSVTQAGNVDTIELSGCLNPNVELMSSVETGNSETYDTSGATSSGCSAGDEITVVGISDDGGTAILGRFVVP